MKQFRDILVYAEVGDEGCLEQVVALAREHGAAITVCEIVAAPPALEDQRGVMERVSKLRWSRAFQRLRRVVDKFAEHMVIDYSVFTGVPFVVIAEQVMQQNFDLVVHISEPVQITGGIGLNATGMHLMRKCPCTVWALHPRREPAEGDVVLALDRELAAPMSRVEAFSMTLAESALAMANARRGKLRVIHAWQPFGAELLEDPELGLSAEERLSYRNAQREDNEQWFRRVVQRIASVAPKGLHVESELIEGPAMDSVIQLVEAADTGLLVLGTVGTSANPGVLIGATTESILTRCRTPVLAIKPPGFVSPLRFGAAR